MFSPREENLEQQGTAQENEFIGAVLAPEEHGVRGTHRLGRVAVPWVFRRMHAVVGWASPARSKLGSVSRRGPPRSGSAVDTPS
jgi:hypothetical protein